VGFLGVGFFRWVYPRKNPLFFGVRTRVSEPWSQGIHTAAYSEFRYASRKKQEAMQMQRDREMHHKCEISHLKRLTTGESRN